MHIGKTKEFKTMPKDIVVSRLIRSFPNAVVTDNDGYLDYEESVYNLAICVIDSIPASQQYYVFGEAFDNYDELYNYMYKNLPGLREELEIFISDEEF